jgi:signal transduction histidine kinase
MWAGRLKQHLLPGAAERDEGFRQEILRIGHSRLPVVAGVEIGVMLFLVVARFAVAPERATLALRLLEAGIVLLIGVATVVLSLIPSTYLYSRAIGWISCAATAFILNWFWLLRHPYDARLDFILVQVTAVMLVAVAAIPLQPVHTLALGVWIGTSHVLLAAWWAPTVGPEPAYLLFIALLTVLTTGLTAELHSERCSAYKSWLEGVHTFEDLRQAQSKVLLSENAASLGRLAAALSHELNSPMGALTSGVDTLLLVAAKQATSPPSEQERLVRLQADLRRSVQESARRLRDIVARMQRFTNLDRAEVQQVDLNGLLGDVCAMLEPLTAGKVEIRLNLNSIPALACRPQQLSAVFSNLLHNAVGALDSGGRIVVSTRRSETAVEVEIGDDGRGVAPEQLRTIFDPSFRVAEGRVSTGNWSMFGTRQIVREHGGEIRIASTPGQGTTVTVSLPFMKRRAATFFLLPFLALLWLGPLGGPQARAAEDVWAGVDRIVAVGDVHGDYQQFVTVLRDAGVVDRKAHWAGGRTHLVQTGDVVDRGPDSRKVMDLLRDLEKQAPRTGGYVHALIGNHEAMNIYGDLRYTTPAEFDAFRGPDSERLRDLYWEQYLARLRISSPEVKADQAYRVKWEAEHPLGFVEQRLQFAPEGTYGKWIIGHNTVIKINDILFVHGGISPAYVSTTIRLINDRIREELQGLAKLENGMAIALDGPLWYTGLVEGEQDPIRRHVETLLSNFGVTRVVVGHTRTHGAVTPLFEGKVIGIDVGLSGVFGGPPACLVVETGRFYAIHRGVKLALPLGPGADVPGYFKRAAGLEPAGSALRKFVPAMGEAR